MRQGRQRIVTTNKPSLNLPPNGGRWVVAVLGARLLQIFLAPPPAFAQEPERDFRALEGIVAHAVQAMFVLVGITSLIGLVMGAYKYIMSEGDSKAVDAAKKNLTWSMIGAIIGVAAWLIVRVVWQQILGQGEGLEFTIYN